MSATQKVRKIVVTGPESSGKSTLCAALAAHYNTAWVPEAGRIFLEGLDRPYSEADLPQILRLQLDLEDEQAQRANRFLFCDTDAHNIRLWAEIAYNRCPYRFLHTIATRPYDAYLLLYPDLPWTPDPLREYPDPKDRLWLWHHHRDAATSAGLPWAHIRGTGEARLKAAVHFLEQTFS